MPNTNGPEKESLRATFSRSVNEYVAKRYPATYVYPSRWLLSQAKQRLAFAKEPVVLPYGFDPSPYEYKSRREARRSLGLPERQHIICISAHFLSEPRKGVGFALRAVAAAADLDPLVVFVGNPVDGVERMIPGVRFWFAGYVENRSRLGLLFAAADVFLFCPLQDNLPISVQEAMGAATPVVGFATGGIVEMVEDGRSAWLVPTGDQARLDEALRNALTSNVTEERGAAAQLDLLKKYSVDQCVQAHEALYRGHPLAANDAGKMAAEMACC